MQICPACVYLLSVSVCTTGTSIVRYVAIIACNLHRIRTGNSVLISNKAGKSLYRLSSYLTAQQNYRFSCEVLNLQGVFYFWCTGNTISPKCCLFICLICFITQLEQLLSEKAASSARLICPLLCFLCHRIHVSTQQRCSQIKKVCNCTKTLVLISLGARVPDSADGTHAASARNGSHNTPARLHSTQRHVR